MNAFQVFWTLPFRGRTIGGNKSVHQSYSKIDNLFSDYYLLTMILSALQWKKLHTGRIKLYTDELVMEYLKRYDLLSIWDEYDTETFANIKEDIDYSTFSSAGKFYAYLNEEAPCIAIDVDLILWNNIDLAVKDLEIGFTHWEDTKPSPYYVPMDNLNTSKTYKFNQKLNWNLMAANTSLVYFKNNSVKNYYAKEVIKFMEKNYVDGEFSIAKPELLFIEQRFLPMCAYELDMYNKMKPFIDTVWHPVEGSFTTPNSKSKKWVFHELHNQELATHIWVEKMHIENDIQRRDKFCFDLLNIILSICPELQSSLEKIDCIKKHLYNFNKINLLDKKKL